MCDGAGSSLWAWRWQQVARRPVPPVPGCGVHSPRAPGENLGFAIRVPSFKKDLGLSWFLGSKAVNARKPVGGTVAPWRLQVPEPRSLGACTRRKGTPSEAGLWLPTLRALQTRRELRREKPVACSCGHPRQSRICPALSPLLFTSPEQPLGPRAVRLGLGAGVGCPTAAGPIGPARRGGVPERRCSFACHVLRDRAPQGSLCVSASRMN